MHHDQRQPVLGLRGIRKWFSRVIVVGFDPQPETGEALRKEAMTSTVAQFTSRMGRTAVDYAHRLVAGETMPAVLPMPLIG